MPEVISRLPWQHQGDEADRKGAGRRNAGPFREQEARMKIGEDLRAIRELSARCAAEHIAPRAGLHELVTFPPDLREALARERLFGIGVPAAYQGMGGGWLHLAAAGMELARTGHSLGVALSWLMHCLLSRFAFFGFCTDRQKLAYLPLLASGARTPCLAISEPGVGGHPKRLTTSAQQKGNLWSISGEKTFLTNGPIADLFVVLAVTGNSSGRKEYTAFIVPAESPGLRRTGPLDLGFLRPCPHGGIVLENCEVPDENVLGRVGHAYEDIALAFRRIEDVMMMAPFVGGARALISLAAGLLAPGGKALSGEQEYLLGGAVSAADSLEVLAMEAASLLDEYRQDDPAIVSIPLFMRSTAALVQEGIQGLVCSAGIEAGQPYDSLAHDLNSSLRIAANVARMRQAKLGRSLAG